MIRDFKERKKAKILAAYRVNPGRWELIRKKINLIQLFSMIWFIFFCCLSSNALPLVCSSAQMNVLGREQKGFTALIAQRLLLSTDINFYVLSAPAGGRRGWKPSGHVSPLPLFKRFIRFNRFTNEIGWNSVETVAARWRCCSRGNQSI